LAVAESESSSASFVGDGLQNHLMERLLENPNPFHRLSEEMPFAEIPPALKDAYIEELERFLDLLRVDWHRKARTFSGKLPALAGLRAVPGTSLSRNPRAVLKRTLLEKKEAPRLTASHIAEYFFKNGFGLFGKYRAFRWNRERKQLTGISHPDPVQLKDLIGHDQARAELLENTRAFVARHPANNVLIYGDRGTGKSSTVKALLNEFGPSGLRLIEVTPRDLADYPVLLSLLRGRRERFILFVDDLSFEDGETSYKGLKALLEGSVEAAPENVVLVATSNRRHLVREYFADREEGVRSEGEVHGQDTVEEKLSLSDRFGLVVSFYAPDQETYLSIVEHMAKKEGLSLAKSELREGALRWIQNHNGRSGRTAKQFIRHLQGKAL